MSIDQKTERATGWEELARSLPLDWNHMPADAAEGWEMLTRAYARHIDLAAQLEEAQAACLESSTMLAKAANDLEAARQHIHEMEITVPHSTIIGLRVELEAAHKENEEQARLLGMSAERELKLLAQLDAALAKENEGA